MTDLLFRRVRVKITHVDLDRQYFRIEAKTIMDPNNYGFSKYYIWYNRKGLIANLAEYNLSPINLRGYTADVLPAFRNPQVRLNIVSNTIVEPFVHSVVQVH